MADLLREGFETDGAGTRYTTSVAEFSDGFGDFFTRTDGSTIGSFVEYTGAEGDFYFAAMDLDGEGAAPVQTLTFSDIDISGAENLQFSALFAEDDDGTDEDWDAADYVQIRYSIDGAAFQTLLAFEARQGADAFNDAPAEDTNGDGFGDGTELTPAFAAFSSAIPETGSSLDLEIEFALDSGDEDIAIDEIAITGDVTTTVLAEGFETDGNGTRYTTSTPEFSDGFGDFFTRTDGSEIGFFVEYDGQEGASYFAAMDLDGEGAAPAQTLTFSDISIAGLTDLTFSGLFAEDDDGTEEDWDAADYVRISYRIDGGDFETLLAFEAQQGADDFNEAPAEDTNGDGFGDGAVLTPTFAEYTAAIAGTGETLDLQIEIALDSGDEDIAFDALTVTGSGTLDATPTLSIADVTVTEGDAGTTEATFTVTLSDDVDGGLSVDFATSDDTDGAAAGSDYTAASGTLTFAGNAGETQTITVDVTGDLDVEADETFSVSLVDAGGLNGAAISDAAGTATGTIETDDFALRLISAVQGSGAASPLDGTVVRVEAIVVGDFQDGDADEGRDLRGFFLQEEDADADGDAATSEGIFVFDDDFGTDVQIGDRVEVIGTASEYFGETQIDTVTSVTVLDSGNPLPTAAEISLPAAATTLSQDGDVQPDLEAFEGMRVTFTDTLMVTEMFQLARFNEIKLVAGDRPYHFTQQNAPDVDGYAEHVEELGARRITYDDGLNVQNALIGNLDGFEDPFVTAGAVGMGDTIDGLSGVLGYSWAGNGASGATWRVRAAEDGENSFDDTNPRELAPADAGGSLKIAAFNVLNYFTTLDLSGVSTAIGENPRGADSQEEFDRQTEKLVTAINAMDVDVLGLIELENDFAAGSDGNAIANLVAELNATGGTWDWVDPGTQFVGGDAIANGFIYDTSVVALAEGTTVEILDDSDLAALGITPEGNGIFDVGASPDDGVNRAVVAATFEQLETGATFTAAVNHFKSKGSLNTTSAANGDAFDGAGRNNGVRNEAAIALEAWLDTDPTGSGDSDFMILGDLNSYAQEDPIQTLVAAGYTDLAQAFIGPDAYGYVFDGQVGTLDYAMANETLLGQVTGLVEWQVNSDEASALDYNLDFGRDAGIFDGSVPARNSDHDPVIVGLSLDYEVLREDVADVESWTTIEQTFTGAGVLKGIARALDDGRLVEVAFEDGLRTERRVTDQGDNVAWQSVSRVFDAEGDLVALTRLNDAPDGREIVRTFEDGVRDTVTITDLADAFDFASISRDYDGEGTLVQTTRIRDAGDGREIVVDYVDGVRATRTVTDVADNYLWDTRTFTYDADGDLLGAVDVRFDADILA